MAKIARIASVAKKNEGMNKWASALMNEWLNEWTYLQNEGVECNDVMNEGKRGKWMKKWSALKI